MAVSDLENLCEEQIDTLQELRDEIVENYLHLKGKKRSEKQEIMLVRVDDLSSHVARIQKHTLRLRSAIQAAIDLHFLPLPTRPMKICGFWRLLPRCLHP